tara:strand:- start:743 stop:1423 length:681 start_codon:yes stop_codon:yes gene_type:complete
MKNKACDAIILAAGKSSRFQHSEAKQYLRINNISLVDIAINNLICFKSIKNLYIVLQKDSKFKSSLKLSNIKYIRGGLTRTKSVYNALKYIKDTQEIPDNILVHDAARPYIENKDLKNLLSFSNSLKNGYALGYPLTNALKKVDKNFVVKENLNRDNLFMALTPQLYNFNKLYSCYNAINEKKINVDDEIEAMAFLSYKVNILFSSIGNIKLTYKEDQKILKKLLK